MARDELDSSSSLVRRGEGETRQAGPACQRERERRGKARAAWAGTGEWATRAGKEKEGEGGLRPAGPWGKERREKREVGRLGWAQGRKEGWGERENKTITFKFENEI
jgi:hypothetical protein